MKQLISLIKTLPTVGRIFSLVAITIALAVLFFFTGCALSSCGTTSAVARIKDKGQATITITTSNPTSVTASPNVDIDLNGNKN